LFLSVDKRSVLVPWDANVAALYANADAVVSYGEFERHPIRATKAVAEYLKVPPASRLEIPVRHTLSSLLQYVSNLPDYDIICRNDGASEEASRLRAIKDEGEIQIYLQAAEITNQVIDLLEREIRSETLKTEIDVALFIEAEARKRDCEGTGFESLVAGPTRSYGIHAFPNYTAQTFGGRGFRS